MKIVTWNVNGLRSCMGKGFMDYFNETGAQAVCLQETKMQPEQADFTFDAHTPYWNSAQKKGYSGTLVLSQAEPLCARNDMGLPEHDAEGRVIAVEYPDFYLVNCYTPNSKRGLERLDYRMVWEDDFCAYLKALDAQKPLILCGDLNVAHQEIDIKNAKANRRSAGFTDEERGKMTHLLGEGFVDAFRALYPDEVQYTWWSYMGGARARNVGWRLDYFVVSERLMDRVTQVKIRQDITGSDHCPVELTLT